MASEVRRWVRWSAKWVIGAFRFLASRGAIGRRSFSRIEGLIVWADLRVNPSTSDAADRRSLIRLFPLDRPSRLARLRSGLVEASLLLAELDGGHLHRDSPPMRNSTRRRANP